MLNMKYQVLLLLILLWLGVTSYGHPIHTTNQLQPPTVADKPDTTWRLVWADEFNTDGKPNARNWTFENGFVRNHELQWYQPENAPDYITAC